MKISCMKHKIDVWLKVNYLGFMFEEACNFTKIPDDKYGKIFA